MEKMTKTYVIFYVLVLVSCAIALLAMTNDKHDAKYVFTDVDSTTYVAGFLFDIVLCFCMGDPATILASPVVQPVAQIFYNSLGKSG